MNTNRSSTRGSTDFIKPAACAMAGAFAAVALSSTSALALDPKQCLPMAEMNAALRAEGQRTMIIGDRSALQNPTGRVRDASVNRYVNTVTSNADGTIGYQLEGDLPRAQASTKVCVAAKLTNIRLYDARRPGVPPQAFLGGQFDEQLRANETIGSRPMIQADTIHANDDGTYRRGLTMTISGNVPARSAAMYTQLPNGNAQAMMIMSDTEYAPAALERLNAPT